MRRARALALLLSSLALTASAGIVTQSGPRLFSGSLTLEEDWQNRISGAGVVWYHTFASVNEVNAFRWTPVNNKPVEFSNWSGNDPAALGTNADQVRRITSDDVDGNGAMEIVRPAGGNDGSSWWRPFAPIQGGTTTGNGRGAGQDDPGASGAISAKSYAPTSGGDQISAWVGGGWYGTDTSGPGGAGEFDGTEYYLQARVKIDPNRITGGNESVDVGKLFYFTITAFSASQQEIVTYSGAVAGGENHLRMYRSVGPALDTDSPGVAVHGNQPGTTIGTVGDGVCRLDNNGGRLANCWHWPSNQWTTVLWHVVPGDNGSGGTLVEVWVAEVGETAYRKIWEQAGVNLPFDSSYPYGHIALIASIYQNGATMTQFYHRYDQFIFSKQFIPAPQVW